jgi:hypothetical protein
MGSVCCNPFRVVKISRPISQGSSCLATRGLIDEIPLGFPEDRPTSDLACPDLSALSEFRARNPGLNDAVPSGQRTVAASA